jgi:hypothetical protein
MQGEFRNGIIPREFDCHRRICQFRIQLRGLRVFGLAGKKKPGRGLKG